MGQRIKSWSAALQLVAVLMMFFLNIEGGALLAQDTEQTITIETLQEQLAQAKRSGSKEALAKALLGIASKHTDWGNFPVASAYSQQAIDLYEQLGDSEGLLRCYILVMQAHYTMHNTDKLEFYSQKVFKIAEESHNIEIQVTALNALAIVNEERKNYEKALGYYHRIEKIIAKDSENMPYLLSNMADCLRMKGNTQEALSLVRKAIKAAQIANDSSILGTAMINEAMILSELGRHTDAYQILEVADRLFQNFEVHDVPRDLFIARSCVAAKAGNYREAFEAHLRFYQIDSTLTSEERTLQFAQLETAFQTQKKEEENERLSTRLWIQWLIIGGGVLLLCLLGGLVLLQRNRLKIKVLLHQTEQQLAAVELQKAKTELEHHKAELTSFTQSLREKTETLEKLKTEASNRHEAHYISDLITQLQQATILTDEQWRHFRQKFERVHDGFFARFQQAIPDATEAEKRLAALSKLDLTGNEIAAMLGISPDSVIKTRYRLRKKVTDGELEQLLQTI